MKNVRITIVLLLGIMLVSGLACGGGTTTWQLSTVIEGQGTVSPSGGTFPDGDEITLTAIPASGWSFDHWGGHINGSENPITITINSDKTIYAYFISGTSPAPTPLTIPCPEWQTTRIVPSDSAAPYGNHIYAVGTDIGLSGSQDGLVGGTGSYDYHIENGQEGVEQATGKVYLENAPTGTDTLIIMPAYSPPGQPIPQDIQEAFNTDLRLETNNCYDYEVVESGQSWLLQDEGISDVFIIAPGYVEVKLENIPGEIGKNTMIPDITLPKEWVYWESPPPSGCGWWVSWALYPQSAY